MPLVRGAELTHRSRAARRYAAVESGGVVSQEALVAACGGAAAEFKGYQLVGVNFLMLLARAGVGGAILADEMARGPPRGCCCPPDKRRACVRLARLQDRRSGGAL
jgi:hypothetical protein